MQNAKNFATRNIAAKDFYCKVSKRDWGIARIKRTMTGRKIVFTRKKNLLGKRLGLVSR